MRGWRRHGLAIVLGAVAAGAMPPFNLVFVLLISFPGLVWLSDGSRQRFDAFALGFSFGFGFFVPGLYWTTVAMFTDIGQFWWAVPFALVGLPIFLSLYTGLALLATYESRTRGVVRILVLGLAWGLGEWLRGHLLTGFPWILIGYAWAGDFPGMLPVLQSVSLFGIYGLSLLTVTVACLPALIGDDTNRARATARGSGGSLELSIEDVRPTFQVAPPRPWLRAAPLAIGALLFMSLAAYGMVRLSGDSGTVTPGVVIRLVQPNIPQTVKWDPYKARDNFIHLLTMSEAPPSAGLSAVVWPEASASFYMNEDARAAEAIGSVAPKGGVMLVGTLRSESADDVRSAAWNSMFVLDGAGHTVATFDKYHLTPFGEYMPLERWLPLHKLGRGATSFSAGPNARTLQLPKLPAVSPMICYEAIFPGQVVDEIHRPDWLLNITNDAWFGNSTGPYQHFEQSRVRAVEEGLPLLRAANTGISGVVDPFGRILQKLAVGSTGVIDTTLPLPLPPTLYARLGNATFFILLLLMGLLTVLCAAMGRSRR